MKIIPTDDYNNRLDAYIKDELKDVLNLTHPCVYQDQTCLKGSTCPLISLPNDACIYYIRGKCKHNYHSDKCKYKHIGLYADTYRKAKEKFRLRESKPLAVAERFLNRFTPYIVAFLGIILNYIIRRVIDYAGKNIL